MSTDNMRPALPLSGLTVLDTTTNIAGPFASLVLYDLGARVIKIEKPGGDESRTWPPFREGVAAPFAAYNRGKESVAVDAKTPEGKRLIWDIAAHADIFIESMRPGKAEALGLSWCDLQQLNRRLIYCSVNAFGRVGPRANMVGFDAIVQAYSGLMSVTGPPDGDPCRIGAPVLDVATGMWSAISVLAALRERDVTGEGQLVESTLLGSAFGFLMSHLLGTMFTGQVPGRLGTAQHNFAPYQAIHARDDMVMIGVNSDKMWHRFCHAIGMPHLANDERFLDNSHRLQFRLQLIHEIETKTRTMPARDLLQAFNAAGIPSSPVRDVGQLLEDPQLTALKLWVGTEPEEGEQYPRVPVAKARQKVGVAPRYGEHTATVLAEFTGTAH